MADDEHKLDVQVLTPEGEVFKGEVFQLSTRTTVGDIGIRSRHVPILARLRPTTLRLHVSEGDVKRWAQAEGWLEVFANQAVVLVEEAIPPDDLDTGELKSRVEDAEQRLKEAKEDSAAAQRAARDKERAEAFLQVAESK